MHASGTQSICHTLSPTRTRSWPPTLLPPELLPPASMRTQRDVFSNGSVALNMVGRGRQQRSMRNTGTWSCARGTNEGRLVRRRVRGVCGSPVESPADNRVESLVERAVDNRCSAATAATLRACGNQSRQALAMTAALRLCDVPRPAGRRASCHSGDSMTVSRAEHEYSPVSDDVQNEAA